MPNKLYISFAFALGLLIPILLVLLSVRLVMTENYLSLIYQRPGFPEDRYGWHTETRLEYGPYGVEYLVQDLPIDYLADLEIDNRPAFQADELKHMEDVQVVTQGAFNVLNACLILFIIGATALGYRPATRPFLWLALRRGGVLTLGLMIVGIIVVVLAWDFFFDTFHALFFEDGTWQFHISDTLIRLYPPQFWFDSTLVIGVLTTVGALLCIFMPPKQKTG